MSIEHLSLNERVYKIIKEKIISSEFPPGFRLRTDHLVKDMGLSRTPIKMCLTKLEQEGLVRSIPRRGTYVIELTTELMMEVYLLREVLEGLAARLATQKLLESDIEKLRDNLLSFDPSSNKLTLERYLELDAFFHKTILDASEHRSLQDALGRLFDIISMFKLRAAARRYGQTDPYQEHMNILKAIQRREPDLAEQAMRFHIRGALDYWMTSLRRNSK